MKSKKQVGRSPKALTGTGKFCQQLESRVLFAASVPTGFAETQLASGLVSPTVLAVAPDGRVFVGLQGGDIRIEKNGTLLPTPFLSLASSYGDNSQGLFGIAFDPNFQTNGYVYIDYTVGGNLAFQRISRFTASGDVAVPGSEDVLFQVGPQTPVGHVGGGLQFGADGKLYFTYGDNQQPNFATQATQLNNFYGKMIRINPDGTIPTDNPYYTTTTGDYRAIWAIGLRNAYSLSEQSTTGLMYIADVGEGKWEDIFQGAAGANYGWPSTEGPTTMAGITPPVYAYPHTGSTTGAYAVIGGPFYNPAVDQFPAPYVGKYFFGDWGSGLIQTIDPANPTSAQTFATGAFNIVSLGAGPDGTLYYLTRGDNNYGLNSTDGQLFQIQYTGSQAPSIDVQPANVTAVASSNATFSVANNGTGPFTYQWQLGGNDISGANASSFTMNNVGSTDNGASLDVVVTNSIDGVTSASATLSVVPHAPPAVTLVSPAVQSFYAAGQALAFSATATESGSALPAGDFAWTINLYHSTNVSTVLSTSGTTSGSFPVPTTALSDADVFYRVTCTVTDADGYSTSVFQNVFPKASVVTLAASVPGLQLTLDGNAITTPYSFLSVVGTTHTIAAPSPQTLAGTTYNFSSWSDNGAASHTLTTAASSATMTATYAAATQVPALPAPWASSNIGATGKAGSASFSGTTFTVNGGGGDIVGTADAFYFVEQSLTGNGQIIARITSQTNTNAWAKAGIMLRETTAAGSKYVALVLTPSHGVGFYARTGTSAAGAGISATAGTAPIWLELARTGNSIVASTSTNGVTWKVVGTMTLAMNATIDAGLMVAAQNNSTTSKATFDNVSVAPITAGAQQTLTATADAYVRDGSFATTNFGSSTELDVKTSGIGFDRYALLTFNLATVTTTTTATLNLFGKISDSTNASITTAVYAVTGTWNESTVTWNTRPAVSTTSLGSMTVTGTTARSYQLDLTAWLQQQKAAGKTTVSLMLKNLSSTSAYSIFSSKESGVNGPKLMVTG